MNAEYNHGGITILFGKQPPNIDTWNHLFFDKISAPGENN